MSNRKNFVQSISLEAKESFLRFPLVLILSMTVASLGIYFIENPNSSNDVVKAIFSSILGIPLSIATYLYFERTNFKKLKYISSLIPLVFIFSHFLLTRSDFSFHYAAKVLQLFIAFHLFLSVAPFLFRNETNGFWHFNRLLLQRILLAVFYSAILFLGLSLGLVFTSYLFDLKFTENIYMKLWILCVFIFQMWFVLAGIPKELKQLNSFLEYPNGLKVLAQYILVPLVLLYLVILYFYLGKIVMDWSLPKGLVGWMVSSMSLFGVLCLLLLHPVKEKLETKWTHFFERYFYFLILPLLSMLFLGLFTRIDEYGFTEKRYFLLILAIWLAVISLYFKISKSNNIKIIPVSLFVLSLITAFGPWGAYQVSLSNQMGMFKTLLEKNKILIGRQVQKNFHDISFEDKRKISSILDYILENHGVNSLKDFLDEKQLNSFLENEKKNYLSVNTAHSYNITELMMESMGLQYIPEWQREKEKHSLYFGSDFESAALNLSGYQTLFNFNFTKSVKKNSSLGYMIQANFEKALIVIYKNDKLMMEIPLSDFIKKVEDNEKIRVFRTIPFKELVFSFENDLLKVEIYFKEISSFYSKNNIIEISHISGIILLHDKEK